MEPPPPSLLTNFFSSLKQVEKRLKLEHRSLHDAVHPPLPGQTNSSPAEESLSSPMFLHFPQTNQSSTLQESTEPPLEFLSSSPQFPLSPLNSESNHPNPVDRGRNQPVDDIQRLIQLLGLGDLYDEKALGVRRGAIDSGAWSSCNGCEGCENGFYRKIVRVKGPKCGKEVERLDGWINYLLNGGVEPLRLAYLLLGKAAFASENGDEFLEGLEFPSTVEDFLLNNPPA